MGDLNIDHKNKKVAWELHSLEREFNIKQLIKAPTRVTQQSQSIIDHMYCYSQLIKSCGILKTLMSDHYPIHIVLKKQPTKYERVTFVCRKVKHLDTNELKN